MANALNCTSVSRNCFASGAVGDEIAPPHDLQLTPRSISAARTSRTASNDTRRSPWTASTNSPTRPSKSPGREKDEASSPACSWPQKMGCHGHASGPLVLCSRSPLRRLHDRWAGARLRGSVGCPPVEMGMMWSTVGPCGWRPLSVRSMGCPHRWQWCELRRMVARRLRHALPCRRVCMSGPTGVGAPVVRVHAVERNTQNRAASLTLQANYALVTYRGDNALVKACPHLVGVGGCVLGRR